MNLILIEKAKGLGEKWMSHRNYRQAYNELRSMMLISKPGEIIVLVAPSRGGKTTMCEKAVAEENRNSESGINTDEMPVCYVVAEPSSTNGKLSTKSFAIDLLRALKHPFAINDPDYDFDKNMNKVKDLSRFTESQLYNMIENIIINRKVKYIIIDEAQHFLYVAGGEKNIESTLAKWKTNIGRMGCVLILSGAYPLLNVVDRSAHFIGRSNFIHFPRYKNNKSDLPAFASILKAYDKYIPFNKDDETLVKWIYEIHEYTYGCIGILESLLRNSLRHMAVNEIKYLTIDVLMECMRPDQFMDQIAKEILAGEQYLRKRPFKNRRKIKKVVQVKNTKPFEKKPIRMEVG